MGKLRFYLAIWASKAVARIIDIVAKGRGTNLPGVVALKLDPLFLRHVQGINPDKAVFLTGTNGKSSTTNLLHHILTQSGYKVISNLGGANMTAGVAVPLLRNCSLTGKLRCDYLVMETDERYVARIGKQIPAKYLGITNIQKDQVQRNGEPSFIREKVREAIRADMTVFLNRDEPNTQSLATAGAEKVIRYGVAPHEASFIKEDDFFSVTMPCPMCHSGIEFHRHNLENVGAFSCPVCGFGSEAEAAYLTSQVSFAGEQFTLNGNSYPFHANCPALLYSYTLAVSIALELGIAPGKIAKALDGYTKKVGLGEQHKAGNHQLKFFRIKQENSETLQSALNVISEDQTPKTLMLGLDEYIDFYPPYINGCYLFDCDMRAVKRSGVRRCVSTSPALGRIGALRLQYAGFDPAAITMLPDSREETLAAALDGDESGNAYLIEEIPFWKK